MSYIKEIALLVNLYFVKYKRGIKSYLNLIAIGLKKLRKKIRVI